MHIEAANRARCERLLRHWAWPLALEWLRPVDTKHFIYGNPKLGPAAVAPPGGVTAHPPP